MPGFLNSIILPLTAAVLIPVIIHFLNKQKTREIHFSSLRFLKLIENKSVKRLRIYQILLIIIRMLFLLFLIIAFARPTLKHSLRSEHSSARTTAVIILDDSYSMQTYGSSGSYFSQAKKIAAAIISSFTNEDKIYLLLPQMSDSSLKQIKNGVNLQKYKVTYSTADFTETLTKAAVILQSQVNLNMELYFISDFRINRDKVIKSFPKINIRTYLIKPQNDAIIQDAAIDSMYLKTNIYEKGKTVEVRLLLHNYGDDDIGDVRLDLFSSDNRVAMEHFSLKKGELREVVLNYIPKESGMQFLQAELTEDDLKTNNTYYLNFLIPKKISLLFVDDNKDIFLSAALNTLSKKTVLTVESSAYTYFQGKDFNRYDIIVMNDPKPISKETVRRLNDFADNNNKAIFIVPGENLSPQQLNLVFSKKLYLMEKIVDNQNSYYAFSRKSIYNNLFKPVFSKYNSSVDLPRIKRYLQINRQASSKILSLENGDSFLSRYSDKGYYIFSSSFSPTWNDFALKGIFVPMLYRIIYAAIQHSAPKNGYIVNEIVKREIPASGAYSKYILKDSYDNHFELMPQQKAGKDVIKITQINKPGIYKLYKNKVFMDAFSINISTDELRKPYADIEKILPNPLWLEPQKDIKSQIFESRSGQELWLFFLILAIFMLFMEMLVIKKIEGKGNR